MAFSWVVKVDDIEFRLYDISIRMIEKVVVRNSRQIIEFKIIDIHGKSFFRYVVLYSC